MNILIPDSWLRDFLKTKATPKKIAEELSLCAASVEKVEKLKDDYLYHVEITTNRVDMASVYGLAREAAAALPRFKIGAALKKLEEKIDFTLKPAVNYLTVKIADPNLCPRFTAILLENITIKPSPPQIQERLNKCGIRPINNVVDVSNYLMLEMGQPMHTFDYDKILGHKMLMRLSCKGESIITLDGTRRKLPEGSIIIEDGGGRIIDLCGIMGGENSAIDQNTRRVLLFVQTYDPVRIRQTCQKLAFRTDAATLFEKSLDPETVPLAMNRAVRLVKETSGGKTVKEAVDIYPNPYKPKIIKLELPLIEKIIGVKIPPKEIINILTSLGFHTPYAIRHRPLIVTVPSWRTQDISIPEDLIEEVARLFGYHNLPVALPVGEIPQVPREEIFYWERRAKNSLKHWGFTEIYTYSMVSQTLLENCSFDPKKTVKLQNPLNEDLVYMRPSLLPSLLSVYQKNQNIESDIRLFEMSNVYLMQKSDLPIEQLRLCAVISGEKFPEAKGVVESLLNDLGVENYESTPYAISHTPFANLWHPLRTARIRTMNLPAGKAGYELGIMGEIHPAILEKLGIKDRVTTFDLDFSALAKLATKTRKYHPLPKYPPIIEDLAIIASPKVLTADISETIKSVSSLVDDVVFWDTFQNTRTFRITYQSMKKTLDDREVGEIRKKIIELLKTKFSAEIKTLNET